MTSKRFPPDFPPLPPNRGIVLLADNGTDLGGNVSIATIISLITQSDITALGFTSTLALPTKLSQFINDPNFVTQSGMNTAITAALANVYTTSTLSFGAGLSYNAATGVLTASAASSTYTLPQASLNQLGGVKVDGTTISINTLTGVISSFLGIELSKSGTPPMDGVGALGISSTAARADHQHPTDSTRAPLDQPAFTTKITAPGWSAAPDHLAGTVGFNTGSHRLEVGNGTAVVDHLQRQGDTMIGTLTLAGLPSAPLEAACKGYVDTAIARVTPSTAPTDYTFTQSTPAAIWTISHGLGRHPSVTIVDSSGRQVEGDVSYDSNNQVSVFFGAAFAGTAYCN